MLTQYIDILTASGPCKREGLRRTGKEGFFWRASEATLMLLDRAIDVAEENDCGSAVCASSQKIASQGLLPGVQRAGVMAGVLPRAAER